MHEKIRTTQNYLHSAIVTLVRTEGDKHSLVQVRVIAFSSTASTSTVLGLRAESVCKFAKERSKDRTLDSYFREHADWQRTRRAAFASFALKKCLVGQYQRY